MNAPQNPKILVAISIGRRTILQNRPDLAGSSQKELEPHVSDYMKSAESVSNLTDSERERVKTAIISHLTLPAPSYS
mgnify:CR=1 FL=1